MARRAYRCKDCGNRIDPLRAANALSRGQEPRFCSDLCRDRARLRRYRERKKEDES